PAASLALRRRAGGDGPPRGIRLASRSALQLAGGLQVSGVSIGETVQRSRAERASVYVYMPARSRRARIGAPSARLSGARRPSVSLTGVSGPRAVATGSNLQRDSHAFVRLVSVDSSIGTRRRKAHIVADGRNPEATLPPGVRSRGNVPRGAG